MISLLKNHQHYSKIYLMEEVGLTDNEKYFVKSSSSLDGINDISTELVGVAWYNSKVNNKINYEICIKRENYIKVKYVEIQGTVPVLTKETYRSNIRYIEIVIDHYCSVWGGDEENDKSSLHGDFSLLGNIIFIDDETPVVIDWEHFKLNAAPIGFDAMYFLFELIWFETSQMNNNICEVSLIHLSKMLLKLKNSNCLSECFINKPLETTKIFMQNNSIYWGSQFDKMPIMFFDKEKTHFIDNIILSYRIL
jgi:hypothetical protein